MSVSLLAFLLQSVPIPPLEEARIMIAEHDRQLFDAAYGCQLEMLPALVHPDLRMVHDQGGLIDETGESFIEGFTELCGRLNEAGVVRRRTALPGTREITLLGEWGILEQGSHSFDFRRPSDEEWRTSGTARYVHVWRWMPEEGRFRLWNVISFAHESADTGS